MRLSFSIIFLISSTVSIIGRYPQKSGALIAYSFEYYLNQEKALFYLLPVARAIIIYFFGHFIIIIRLI